MVATPAWEDPEEANREERHRRPEALGSRTAGNWRVDRELMQRMVDTTVGRALRRLPTELAPEVAVEVGLPRSFMSLIVVNVAPRDKPQEWCGSSRWSHQAERGRKRQSRRNGRGAASRGWDPGAHRSGVADPRAVRAMGSARRR
jgi:hypothetical protein